MSKSNYSCCYGEGYQCDHRTCSKPDERFTVTVLGAMFNVRDTNQDMKITKADLMDPRHQGGWTEAESKAYMSLFGEDEDGAIEFGQYLRIMTKDIPVQDVNPQAITLGECGIDAAVLWEKEMKEVYNMCGKGNLLTPNGAQHFLASQGLHWRPQDKKLFMKADVDGDLKLNFEEFKDFLLMEDWVGICECSNPKECGLPHAPRTRKPLPKLKMKETDE